MCLPYVAAWRSEWIDLIHWNKALSSSADRNTSRWLPTCYRCHHEHARYRMDSCKIKCVDCISFRCIVWNFWRPRKPFNYRNSCLHKCNTLETWQVHPSFSVTNEFIIRLVLHVETVKKRTDNKNVNVICNFLCFKATQNCVILTAFEGASKLRESYDAEEFGEKRFKSANGWRLWSVNPALTNFKILRWIHEL